MQVLFTRYAKCASAAEPGTLSYLCNIINRRNVTGHVSKEMNAVEDFLHSVLHSSAAAAMASYFGMDTITSEPTSHGWSAPLVMAGTAPSLKWTFLSTTLAQFVTQHIMPRLTFTLTHCGQTAEDASDMGIQNYAWGLLSDLLVAEEFIDAIREGDGDRVFRVWKLLHLYFRASGHTKYALESVLLVADVKCLQSEQMAHRLLWSRFVNTRGLGNNISCDLHMEHLNLAYKTHLGTAGGNVTEKTLIRTGKALSTLRSVTEVFDHLCSIHPEPSAHSHKSAEKDEHTMTTALVNNKVYTRDGNHQHFKNFPFSYFGKISKEKYKSWIQGHIKRLYRAQIQQLCLRQHGRFGAYLASHAPWDAQFDHPLTGSLFDDSSDCD